MMFRANGDRQDDKSRSARRTLEHVDALFGFLCFGVVLLVGTIVARLLSADTAVAPALLLLILSLVIWGLLKVRKRLAATAHPQKVGE